MAKTTRASRAQSYFPVKIPIYSLSGGVGRQIPSKRLPTEVDELINVMGAYDFQVYMGQKLDTFHAPKRGVTIPAGGRQARMTELLDGDSLEPTGRSWSSKHPDGKLRPKDMGKELDVSVINAQPEDMWDKVGGGLRPPMTISPREAESWWATSRGFATKRDIPVDQVMRTMPELDQVRWHSEFEHARESMEKQLGRKMSAGEWQQTKEDYMERVRQFRVNPVDAGLYSPGALQGVDSLHGRLPWLHASDETPGIKPWNYTPMRLRQFKVLKDN